MWFSHRVVSVKMVISSPNGHLFHVTKKMPRFYGDRVYGRLVYGSPRKENHCTVHPSGLHGWLQSVSRFSVVSKGVWLKKGTEASILIPSDPLLEPNLILIVGMHQQIAAVYEIVTQNHFVMCIKEYRYIWAANVLTASQPLQKDTNRRALTKFDRWLLTKCS